MRSGAQAPDDDSTRQFKAQSQRLMGDMNDAGDAPFGGEMQVDSQVHVCLPMSGKGGATYWKQPAKFGLVSSIQRILLQVM